jgi:hypothetical protein
LVTLISVVDACDFDVVIFPAPVIVELNVALVPLNPPVKANAPTSDKEKIDVVKVEPPAVVEAKISKLFVAITPVDI